MSKQERNGWFVCITALVLQAVVMYKAGALPVPVIGEHKLDIVIAHEGTAQDEKLAMLWQKLRNGKFATYCKEHGHTLEIVDKDVTDENGVKIIPEADLAGKTLPVVLVYDKGTHKLEASATLVSGDSDEKVLQITKGAGG